MARRIRYQIIGASTLLLCPLQLALAQSTPVEIHESNRTVIGGTLGGGLIINPVKCTDEKLFFRRLQGSSVTAAPIVSVSRDGKSSHVFDFLGQSTTSDLKGLAVADFAATSTDLYLLAKTSDLKTHILKYLQDGKFDDDIVLDDDKSTAKILSGDLNASKLGIMPTGQFLVIGVRAKKTEEPGQPVSYRYSPAVELYGRDGRFQTPVSFKSDSLDLNSSKHGQGENFLPLDVSLVASGPDGIYFGMQGPKLNVYFISPAGDISTAFSVEPEKNFRAMNMDVMKGQLLVEWGTSSEGTKPTTRYNLYSLSDGEPLSAYVDGPNFGGIFACFDGRRTFTFISSDQMGQRILKNATP